MASDLNKKTLRHFYCRDTLWQTFERMSEDLDRGIDDLGNEAMRLLAREKGYLANEGAARPSSLRDSAAPAPQPAAAPPPKRPPPPPAPPARSPLGTGKQPAAPPPPARSQVPAGRAPGRPTIPVATAPAGHAAAQPAPPLYLVFQNQKYLIDKDQFIIGRGSKSSDLPIRDGNISRKHAAVVRRDGGYYIKDLGSTNGIDFNGARIDNKRIEEGDIFSICEYQLKFTYR